MTRGRLVLAALALAGICAGRSERVHAQDFPTADSTIRRIWVEGMERSQTYPLAQAMLDSIGPRLTGSPGMRAAQDWLVARYRAWGIPGRNERYGTWYGWERGITHLDLIAPRVRTLDGMLVGWSPGTGGREVTAPAIVLPEVADSAAFVAWLPRAKGKFVLLSRPRATCRPDENWKAHATPESFAAMEREREAARERWAARQRATGYPQGRLNSGALGRRLEAAGVAGVITTRWREKWGAQEVFTSQNRRVPELVVSCEDYGLVFRLAERNQGPLLRLRAESRSLGEVPVANTIAELRGTEKPDEYVILSAHLDSFDGASGAIDNGTGTITMLEAMRILKAVYPRPKRTILVAHWSGEEQGADGSQAFAADHPEVVRGVQVLYNQDSGTGRIGDLTAGGLISASGYLARWAAHLPTEISRHLTWTFPGRLNGGRYSDYGSFACYGALALRLGSESWDYDVTWHTNLDTFDKIVFDDLEHNATTVAMLAYLASEEPTRVPRDHRVVANDTTAFKCFPPARTWAERKFP